MARRCESAVEPISANGYRVYLPAKLTTDYGFPFDPGDPVTVCIVPHRGIVVTPPDRDIDPARLQL